MVRVHFLRICLVVIAVGASALLPAQTHPDQPAKKVWTLPAPVDDDFDKHARTLPAPVLLPPAVPFSVDTPRPDYTRVLQVLPADEMTPHDRDLAADAESSIQERAGFENLEFNDGPWTYTQLVCPALPKHLLLRFTRHDGTRAMSMFSAAIPRDGEGRVRIIPIVRKGYSLFSPAPIGPITISAFNHIRAEDHPGHAPDWVATGLCYAALAGANPQAEILQSNQDGELRFPLTLPPTLLIEQEGTAIISFNDTSDTLRPKQWKMVFDRKGKLLKATHAPVDAANSHQHAVRTYEIDSAADVKQP
jgi:hypothetical protein